MNVKGMVAAITGGGSGLGKATAKELTDAGAKVAILDINQASVDAAAAEFGGLGVLCDVADSASGEAAIAKITDEMGAPRILVNCAGVGTPGRAVGKEGPMALANFERVVQINLVGTFNMIRLCAAVMQKLEPLADNERGVIVNTASVAAFDGQIGQAAYSASKAGVHGMTLPLAREFAQFGIRVCTIAPGIFWTPMLATLPQAAQDSLGAQVPFPKRLGQPSEYARLVRHICENAMLNAETIRLDGGIRMGMK
jgi:NAD(P)-dependent dehydrogenase (short-subunit alcohol dehydrogenase family)